MRRRTLTALALAAFAGAACGDTDVANRGGEVAPGQEIEDGAVLDVEPVDIQAQPWFQEDGTLEFNGRTWMLSGNPVFDPDVEYVGEYQGTPLYGEVNVMAPHNELFIPLENDYWQMLQPASGPTVSDTAATMTGVPVDGGVPADTTPGQGDGGG